MLDPVQNHALRLCLGAYRTSSSSLCVLANEPPLYLRRKKLSMQYCLKLSATSQNPAYSAVFAGKFKSFVDNKPNQIPTLGTTVPAGPRRPTTGRAGPRRPTTRHLRTVESYNISVLNSRNCKFSGDDFFCLSKKTTKFDVLKLALCNITDYVF